MICVHCAVDLWLASVVNFESSALRTRDRQREELERVDLLFCRLGWHVSRLHAFASERNYISKEPIETCIPIEDAQTLNGTLIGG